MSDVGVQRVQRSGDRGEVAVELAPQHEAETVRVVTTINVGDDIEDMKRLRKWLARASAGPGTRWTSRPMVSI